MRTTIVHEATLPKAYDKPRLLAIALLALTGVMRVILICDKSLTYDEVAHLPAGVSYWETGEIVLNPMQPPLVKELCALGVLWLHPRLPADAQTIRRMGNDVSYQRKFGHDFFDLNGLDRVVFWGRLPAVLLSLGVSALVWVWASELWGPWAGVLAAYLSAFDPTLTAHSQFVTTDVGLALGSALFIYLIRRFVRSRSPGSLIACGITLGAALGTKYSAVLLLPLGAILLFIGLACRSPRMPRGGRWQGIADVLVDGMLSFSAILAIAYTVVWAIYLFPADPWFYARALASLGEDNDPRYLHFFMGELRHASWPSYFLVAWLVKTPLAELLLVAAATASFAFGPRASFDEEAYLLLPLVGLFVGYSWYADPIGVRYILVCYPFLFVFTARIASTTLLQRRLAARVIPAALCAWIAVEFIRIWPDHLSYFNQVAGGARGGVRWLDDSNVDWGQGLIELRRYVKENHLHQYQLCSFTDIAPRRYGVDGKLVRMSELVERPPRRLLIASSHCIARVGGRLRELYGEGPRNWIAHTGPIAFVGHAYWVYDVRAGGVEKDVPQ